MAPCIFGEAPHLRSRAKFVCKSKKSPVNCHFGGAHSKSFCLHKGIESSCSCVPQHGERPRVRPIDKYLPVLFHIGGEPTSPSQNHHPMSSHPSVKPAESPTIKSGVLCPSTRNCCSAALRSWTRRRQRTASRDVKPVRCRLQVHHAAGFVVYSYDGPFIHTPSWTYFLKIIGTQRKHGPGPVPVASNERCYKSVEGYGRGLWGYKNLT